MSFVLLSKPDGFGRDALHGNAQFGRHYTKEMNRIKHVAILFLAVSTGFSSASHAFPSQVKTDRDSLSTIQIVGGEDISISTAPWQVALISTSRSSNFQGQFCGGSIISREWIVTAAHCVDGGTTINSFRVLAGTATLSTTALSGNLVNSIIVHPDWNPDTNENDIALVQMKVPLVLKPGTIETIEIPSTKPTDGTTALISGWGSVLVREPSDDDDDDYWFPTRLQGAEIFVHTDAECSTEFPDDFFPDLMICANDLETDPSRYIDTCQADSGGPLATLDTGNWYLSGITSWGVGCGIGYSGVYTNVAFYDTWISDNAIDKRYRVTFNSKGGSSVSASSFAAGVSLSTPASPTRSGYTFAGWALTDGGTKLSFPYKPRTAADFTLYAKWTKNVKAVATVKPTDSGTAKVGKSLTAKKGTWTGSPIPSTKYQWYSCSKAVTSVSSTVPSACKAISGAIKYTLKLTNAQKGKWVTVLVTGTSSGTSKTSWLAKSTGKVN